MKNLIFLFLLFSSPVLAQSNIYTVSGKVKGLDTDTMYMSYKNENGVLVREKIPVKDETFKYSGTIGEMEMMTIWPNVERTIKKADRGYYPAKSSQFQFIAFPGAEINFSGNVSDFVNAYPSGDAANDDLATLNKTINPLMNNSVNIAVKIANKVITDSAEIRNARQEADKSDREVNEIKRNFIASRPSSSVSAWLLEDMMLRKQVGDETAMDLYKKLDQSTLRANPFFAKVVQRIEGIQATAIGQTAPEIKSNNTYKRKPFNLATLRGKYVVLDFWGTWCGPCISGMPKLKEYLDKYKSKMEIVGIAQESDDGTRWRDFLDKNEGYQWHQVLSRPDNDFILKYSVAGFPTKIIIDPDGKVVARYVGEDDGIYNRLDEIFKNK